MTGQKQTKNMSMKKNTRLVRELNANEEVKDSQGWEEKMLEDETILYIDHRNEITTQDF